MASSLFLVLVMGMGGPTAGGPLLRDGHWSGRLGQVRDTTMAWAVIAFDAADNLTAGGPEQPIARWMGREREGPEAGGRLRLPANGPTDRLGPARLTGLRRRVSELTAAPAPGSARSCPPSPVSLLGSCSADRGSACPAASRRGVPTRSGSPPPPGPPPPATVHGRLHPPEAPPGAGRSDHSRDSFAGEPEPGPRVSHQVSIRFNWRQPTCPFGSRRAGGAVGAAMSQD